MLRKLARWITTHPITSSSIVILCIAVSLIKVKNLQIDSSTKAFMGEHDPERQPYEEFKERFGSDILSLIIVPAPSDKKDVFNPETLTLIQTLTDEIYDLDGVTRIQSLTTVNQILGEDDYLNTEPLLDYIPDDTETLAKKRNSALDNPLLTKNVVSTDGRYAAINVFTDSSGFGPGYEDRFVEKINELIKTEAAGQGVFQVGTPRFNVFFSTSIEEDQKTLVPIAILVILIVLYLVFRRGLALTIPVVTGGLSIMATMGFMAWMGFSVTAVSVMVPSILIVVGCTEDVHLISEFYKTWTSKPTVREAILEVVDHSIVPISLTSLTTMLGFGALALNDIPVLREFGIVTFFGLAFNYVTTLVFVPAMLHLNKNKSKLSNGILQNVFIRATESIIKINLTQSKIILTLTALVIVISILGCLRLEVDNDPIKFFDPSTPIIQDFQKVHTDICGVHGFSMVFDAEEPGDMLEPEVMTKLDRIQTFISSMDTIDKVISPVDFIKTMNREIRNDPKSFAIPSARETIAEYLLLLDGEDLARHLDPGNQFANMVIRHNLSGSKAVKDVLTEIRHFMADMDLHYSVDGEVRTIKWDFTGEAILLHNATDAMITGQVKSLSLALVTIMIIISILFMSLKAGLLAMFSNVVPIVINFGIMGWLDIPFNTGTCLVATIALGIAVDDTIHFMVRYQSESRKTTKQSQAMILSLRGEGGPIMTTSFALFLGFGVMMLSNFVPSIHFGFLSSLIMIYALVTDLFVNPVLLSYVHLITLWDYIALKVDKTIIYSSAIFQNFTPSEIKKMALLASLEQVKAFERVVEEGTHGNSLYVVLSGEAIVFLEASKEKTLQTMKPGDLFGEMALLGGGIRTASVRTTTDSALLRLDMAGLNRISRRNPDIALKFYKNISTILSNRVQQQTSLIIGPATTPKVDQTIRGKLSDFWKQKED